MSLDEGQEGFCHRPTAGISKTEGYSKQAGYERRRAIVERLGSMKPYMICRSWFPELDEGP